MNRDDHHDVNAGLQTQDHWMTLPAPGSLPQTPRVDLYKTAIRVSNASQRHAAVHIIQAPLSPMAGIIRYSTRVTLFTGEGSKIHSGSQEAGLLILGKLNGLTEFNSTFLGIAFDAYAPETFGHVVLRVGNGTDGFQTDRSISDKLLPFKITEGEYALSVDHDVGDKVLKRVQINGFDITQLFSPAELQQRVQRGVFGMRSTSDPGKSGVHLQQFYWYYRVEAI
jgi:hypothetical protein